jgi:hypothetical protein
MCNTFAHLFGCFVGKGHCKDALRSDPKRDEVPDPMHDETHYNQEINEAPYLICTPKPAEMVEAARVAKIDAQIVALERQAIDTGLVRTLIDDLLARSLQLATQAGVTEAELLDPESPNYSRAYAKVHANAAERAALRALR